eukprot:GSA25T00015562001.1
MVTINAVAVPLVVTVVPENSTSDVITVLPPKGGLPTSITLLPEPVTTT